MILAGRGLSGGWFRRGDGGCFRFQFQFHGGLALLAGGVEISLDVFYRHVSIGVDVSPIVWYSILQGTPVK